jgi:transcriptional regulator GlxA family with amidase domain
MSEIAFECGFTNQYHFTRIFKRITRMPPRESRKYLRARGREDQARSLPLLVTIFDDR